jgi:hypothetical protein
MNFNSCGASILFSKRKEFSIKRSGKVGHQLAAPLPLTKTILRAMKLAMILLVVASLHVSAKADAQKVTFSGTNVGLQTIFDAIQQQTGYGVFIDDALLKQTKNVTVKLKDADIEDALGFLYRRPEYHCEEKERQRKGGNIKSNK